MRHDQSGETGIQELAQLSKQYDVPQFVKAAQAEEYQAPANATLSIFADVANRAYPCHTKAATWVSALFFVEKKAEHHPKMAALVEQRLQKLVSHWGLDGEYAALKTKHASLHQPGELPDSAYAYVFQEQDGTKTRRLPMRSALETKAAAEYLQDNIDAFALPVRKSMAQRILTKAASYGASLGDQAHFLERQAGRGICDKGEVVQMLRNRAYLARFEAEKNAKLKGLDERLLQMADTVNTNAAVVFQPEQMFKLAMVVDCIDREGLKLAGKYTATLPRPEDVIFKASLKECRAELEGLCELPNGEIFKHADLQRVRPVDLEELFGTDFVTEVRSGLGVDSEKLAEQLRTLPRNDVDTFSSLMREQGITPAGRAKQAKHLMAREQLEKLAAAY